MSLMPILWAQESHGVGNKPKQRKGHVAQLKVLKLSKAQPKKVPSESEIQAELSQPNQVHHQRKAPPYL